MSGATSRTARYGLRWVAAGSVALSLLAAAAPAQAAAPVTSHLRSAVTPSTVLVGAHVVVSGAVSPTVSGKQVYLQRLEAGKWKTLAHKASGKHGVYSFAVHATGKPGVWSLRVIRPASSTAKAVIGKKFLLLLTRTGYKLTINAVTKVNAGAPIVVSGAVTPKTTGKVTLQELSGGKWNTLAIGVLTKSTYSFSKLEPAGMYPLRVVKTFNATYATGESAPVTVTVFGVPAVAPKLALSSPDDAILQLPGHRLVFSTQHSLVPAIRDFTYTNTGSATVTVSGLAIQGADASSYSLAAGQDTTLTIPPGGTATVGIQFNPTPATNCPTTASPYNIGDSVRIAALVFSSTDPGLPGGEADLGGVNACSTSGTDEPVLDQVMQALGYTDVVDTPTVDHRFLGQVEKIPGTDEISSPYFKVANPAQPVSLVPVTHYSTTDTVPYHAAGWYAQGSNFGPNPSCTAACNQLWQFPADPPGGFNQNQKLLPVPVGTETFTPSTTFGLYLGEFTDVNFSDDSLNVAHGTDNQPLVPTQYLHDMRVYPAYGVGHVAIPYTYIVAVDVTRVPDFKNNDFQDVVMVLHNVVPAS